MSFFDDIKAKIDEVLGGGDVVNQIQDAGQQHLDDATQQIEEVKNNILPGDNQDGSGEGK